MKTFIKSIEENKNPLYRYKPCVWCKGFDFVPRKLLESPSKYLNVCSSRCLDWYAYTNFPYYSKPNNNDYNSLGMNLKYLIKRKTEKIKNDILY